jgi:hypothetical protein
MSPIPGFMMSTGVVAGGGGLSVIDADLATYTEDDAGGYISVAGTKATVTNMPRTVDSYVYQDYGAAAFNADYEILFELGGTSSFPLGGLVALCSVANVVDDLRGCDDLIAVALFGVSGANTEIRIVERVATTEYAATGTVINKAITNWCKLVRDESAGTYGTVYLYVATSESNRDSETGAQTLSLGLHAQADFSTFYAVQSYNITGGTPASFYVDHIDIQAD